MLVGISIVADYAELRAKLHKNALGLEPRQKGVKKMWKMFETLMVAVMAIVLVVLVGCGGNSATKPVQTQYVHGTLSIGSDIAHPMVAVVMDVFDPTLGVGGGNKWKTLTATMVGKPTTGWQDMPFVLPLPYDPSEGASYCIVAFNDLDGDRKYNPTFSIPNPEWLGQGPQLHWEKTMWRLMVGVHNDEFPGYATDQSINIQTAVGGGGPVTLPVLHAAELNGRPLDINLVDGQWRYTVGVNEQVRFTLPTGASNLTPAEAGLRSASENSADFDQPGVLVWSAHQAGNYRVAMVIPNAAGGEVEIGECLLHAR